MRSTCPTTEELYALALADLPQRDADVLTAHLAGCERCRAEYGEIAGTVDHLLAAAPAVDPPPGFSSRVLAAMGLGADDGGPLTRRAEDRGPLTRRAEDRLPHRAGDTRRRLPLWIPAAAAGVLLGVAGTVTVGGLTDGPPAAGPAGPSATTTAEPGGSPTGGTQEPGDGPATGEEEPGGELPGAALLTAGGESVGSVARTWFEGRPVLVVTVTDGRPGVTYECWLVADDGSRVSGGRWTTDDYGDAATWVVEATAAPARVELVGPSGSVWAGAEL